MIKSELIERVAERHPHLRQNDIEAIVGVVFGRIAEGLANGTRIELRGFGVFTLRHRDARTGRNPRTGESVSVTEKHAVLFRAGKELRDRVNSA